MFETASEGLCETSEETTTASCAVGHPRSASTLQLNAAHCRRLTSSHSAPAVSIAIKIVGIEKRRATAAVLSTKTSALRSSSTSANRNVAALRRPRNRGDRDDESTIGSIWSEGNRVAARRDPTAFASVRLQWRVQAALCRAHVATTKLMPVASVGTRQANELTAEAATKTGKDPGG